MRRGAWTVPASAATPAAALLRGEVRTGRVLAVFGSALVISVPSPSGSSLPGPTGERQLSLLTRRASGVPNGVRLPVDFDAARLHAFVPGDRVSAGEGRIDLGTLEITVVREWVSKIRRGPVSPAVLATLAAAVSGQQLGIDACRVTALREAIERGGVGLADTATGLVGVGSGLTPAGDDVLSGAAVGLRATRRDHLVEQIAAAVDLTRTNALSADLLRLSFTGHASTEILAVLRHLKSDQPGFVLQQAISRLLAVGHTSGADLAAGLLLGLTPVPETAGPVSI